MTKKLGIILTAMFVGMALLAWLFMASAKPLPGEKALQAGRDHQDGTKLTFQFNPPTSGDHYSSWISKGFYDEPRADGYLVHSQEHGYVIIWYDCERKVTFQRHPEQHALPLGVDSGSILYRFRIKSGMTINEVYAHEEATPAASSMSGGSSGIPTAHFEDMPKSFSDGSCDSLKTQLKDLYQKNAHKLIIMPRVRMDAPIILTAWGRMEKLDSLDQNKIKSFIDAFRDNGPEATNEP